jgi:hypothetical protein
VFVSRKKFYQNFSHGKPWYLFGNTMRFESPNSETESGLLFPRTRRGQRLKLQVKSADWQERRLKKGPAPTRVETGIHSLWVRPGMDTRQMIKYKVMNEKNKKACVEVLSFGV